MILKNYSVKEYTQWPKGVFHFQYEGIDALSVPFTWLLPTVRSYLRKNKIDKAMVGGPAVKLLPHYFDGCDEIIVNTGDIPGVLQMINPWATRSTLGCPRNCGFCAVKTLEPDYIELDEWPDKPIYCDNNILHASQPHFDKVMDKLERWGFGDFNQGIDLRKMEPYHMDRFQRVRELLLRVAVDHDNVMPYFDIFFRRLLERKMAIRRVRVLALIAWNMTPEQSWTRCLYLLQKYHVIVCPMWFSPLNSLQKSCVTEEQVKLGWTEKKRVEIMRYFYDGHRVPTEPVILMDGKPIDLEKKELMDFKFFDAYFKVN